MNELLNGFQLGDFEVLPLQGRIRGPAGETAVHPRAMEVLLCLAQSPGELLERDELRRRVWGRRPVRDATLTRCVGELRQALDDHHDDPHYIQTVQHRGYRLVAPVHSRVAVGPPATAAPADPAAPVAAPARNSFWQELSRRRVIRVALAYGVVAWIVTEVAATVFPGLHLPDWTVTLVIILAVLGFPVAVVLAWAFQLSEEGVRLDRGGLFGTARQRRQMVLAIGGAALLAVGAIGILLRLAPWTEPAPEAGFTPARASIAILPFVSIGTDPDLDYYGDGLAEELTTMLARLDDLAVASRTAAFYFGEQKAEFGRIAESLRVRHILEGSVRRDENRLRVNAQLIDANTGYHLWSEVYDRELDDVFGILDDMARHVVERMNIELSTRSLQLLANMPTGNAKAYDAYLRARGLIRQPHSDELLEQVRQLYEAAVTVDPGFASAWAGLCETQLFTYIRNADPATFRQAEQHCIRALALAPTRPEVRMAVGELYRRSGRFEEAIEEYRQVLAHNPRDYDALLRLAEAYKELDRPAEAVPLYRQAIALEPSYWAGYNYLARFHFRYLQDREAAENFRRVTELRPDHPLGYINLGAALLSIDPDEALKAWTRALALSDSPPSPVLLSNLGLAHYYQGDIARAIAFQREALEAQPRDAHAWARLAAALRLLPGGAAESREAYERAVRLLLQQLALNPNDTGSLRILATSHAWLGDRAEAEQALQRLEDIASLHADNLYAATKVALAFGDAEAAAERLRAALEQGYPAALARVDPELEPLRRAGTLAMLLETQHEVGE